MSRRSIGVMLILIAASTPAALGLEWVIRRLFLPPVMDEFRDWMRPTLSPFAWLMVGLALAATWVAWALNDRLYQRSLRRLTRGRPPTPQQTAGARFQTLLLVTSIPQVPALVATIGFTFGASFAPTLVTVCVGTLGVLVQWLGVRRLGGVAPPAPVDRPP